MTDAAPAAQVAAAPAAAAAAAVDPHPHKVFVGNLPFTATADAITAFFAPAGPVTDVNIISRGTRSLGYAFVAFATLAECERAVAQCHKQPLDGREINVEVAKPKSELPPKPARKPRAPKPDGEGAPARKPRGKKAGGEPSQQETEDGVIVSHSDADGKKKRKPRKKRAPKTAEDGEGDAAAKTEKPKRTPRPRRPPPSGEPSKTTVFVSNLPFSLTNDTLAAVFDGYNVTKSTVIIRKATNRSKGFGFVEMPEADQARLLADVAGGKKFVSEERELGVKVALSDQQPDAGADAATAAATDA